MEPLVSIITPSYNSGKYLAAYFGSIFRQDYKNYEIIFINDGSTDNTEEIAIKYKHQFEETGKRFVYLKQPNGGQAKAMNCGFPYLKGKYFIWPDSDDELYPNNISEKVRYMEEHPEIALVMSSADYVDEQGNVINHLVRARSENDNLFRDLLLSKNVIFCPGVYMMKREAFLKCIPNGHINESRIGQNYQILLPVVYSERWGYIDKTLYKYIFHKNSHSNIDKDRFENQIERFTKHEETLYELLEEICSLEDKEFYSHEVYKHFHQFYLRLANKYGRKKDLKKYYHQLKMVNANGTKEKIYYLLGILGIKRG